MSLAGVGLLGHHIKLSTCAGELAENCISATGKSYLTEATEAIPFPFGWGSLGIKGSSGVVSEEVAT